MVLPLIAAGALLSDPRTRNPQGPIHKVLPGIPGITQGIFPGPTTAPVHHNFNPLSGHTINPRTGAYGYNPSIADPRTRQQQMQNSQNLLGGLVGSVANLPGVRQTPLRLAGDLASTLLNSGALNPYNHVKY